MKKLLRRVSLALAVGVSAFSLPPSASGQQSIGLRIYPLTNSLSGTNMVAITNGSTLLKSGATYVVTSQPFPIWRGRGFTLNLAAYNTNSASTNGVIQAQFRYGSVHYSGSSSTLLTNWSLYSLSTFATAGTTETNWSSLVAPTTVDNMSLGQLYSVTCIATNDVWFDPTNAYIGVLP